MAKGNRGGQRAGQSKARSTSQDYPEAFHPGKDYQAVNGVDHVLRTVSRTTQQEWDVYATQLNKGVTAADETAIMKDFDWRTGDVYGYVRTTNAFAINKALYDPNNAGKTDAQIFSRPQDRQTVAALDKSIANNVTPANASYTRFTSANAIQSAFGLTNQEMSMIAKAPQMNAAQLAQLNKILSGKTSYSRSFTSASANRSLNAFGDPTKKQSRGFFFERKLNVPQGTHAYAPMKNAQESEVIFGRRMGTKLAGISVSSDGHIVFHEWFDGYKK